MKKDILNRAEFLDRIIKFTNTLSEHRKGTCFAIDGKWGSGKTFLLEMLQDKLRIQQNEETIDDRYLVINYNCWQYDYYDEPAVALVSAMLDSIDKENSLISPGADVKILATWDLIKTETKKIAGKFTENHIGIDVVETFEKIKNNENEIKKDSNDFDPIFKFKKTLDETRVSLSKIAEKKTVVIIVDELDRCMPSYAIKVLERLHHFFYGIDNIIVIIAVDSKQLNHSIKEIYGDNVDEKAFLRKFIECTFRLDTGKINGNIIEKYNEYFSMFEFIDENDKGLLITCFNNIWLDQDMRTQERAMEKIRIIHNLIYKEKLDSSFALFEIMYARFKDSFDESLEWLIQRDFNKYPTIGQFISKETLDFIFKMRALAETGGVFNYFEQFPPTYELYNNTIGKCIYYFYTCYPNGTRYCMKNSKEITENDIDFINVFVKLIQIIE